MPMPSIRVRRHELELLPDCSRVIIRPFIPTDPGPCSHAIERVLALTELQVSSQLDSLQQEFDGRHHDLEFSWAKHYNRVSHLVETGRPISGKRQLLIGAMFSGEYALECAALFNPSIVPHPDQSDAPAGGIRFILSLRATGEGHISSIEFRAGQISAEGTISLDPTSRFVSVPEIVPDLLYEKESFCMKVREMENDNRHARAVMQRLDEHFTISDLQESIGTIRAETPNPDHLLHETLEYLQWLADSNYELLFSKKLAISERIIFPVSRNESNGIEDARFVRFVEEDGEVIYRATYTAYNGHAILPQLIETCDFLRFNVLTLNGNAVQNKGMALFPRRIYGKYVMLSRQDDENLFIMFSDYPHHWNNPEILLRPAAPWESVKIGNCGSPVETEAGWLVITHGVGPMRKYCIGAVLLDLEDPTRVIGRLRHPLLCPEGDEREGYVPNVVYSCGSLLHGRELILPYAVSDHSSAIASVSLDDLLQALQAE
jgi:predicted GH43/DUF377 family glycosyl hydrolase